MDISLGKLEHVDPRDLWEREAGSFTPWLANNLGLLSEALGLDLELVKTESSVGAFACDIEARETGRDRPVIIENQLEATDHRHLGQLLTYASGLDGVVVVWISPQLRDEHRQALDWLNRHTDDEIDFFGVVLELVRIDNSKPAIQFRPVAFPNVWTKTSRRLIAAEVSERAELYRRFFQGVLDQLREKYRFTNARAAQPQSWYSFSSGIRGCSFSASFASGARMRAEVYIDVGDFQKNKAIFDWLLNSKDQIETEMGEPMEWERLDAKRACRISVVRRDTTIEVAAAHSDEMQTWLIGHLLEIKEVFLSLLREATTVAEMMS